MLKIKKTKPYQHSYKSYIYYICILTLICGIVSSLALLTYYNTDKTYAAGADITSINTMQEMKPYICDNTEIGTSHTLTDIRDNSTYIVAKLSDSKCWMTQNLRIIDKEITSADSDVSADFTIPPSALWDSNTIDELHAYYDNDTNYGAYYNWYTATAGTGTAEIISDNAKSSICPKGWKLPAGGKTGAFQNLYKKFPDADPAGFSTYADKNGHWIGGNSVMMGGTFFPASGYIKGDSGSAHLVGDSGLYWSSKSLDSPRALNLVFSDKFINPSNLREKYHGLSVRCIAEGWPSKDVNVVAVRVSPVISIDATSGMKEEVDPNKVTTGTISATVSANTTYAVQLSASKTSLTNSVSSEEPISTNSIPASFNVQAKTNAWGILNQDNSTYSAITINPTTYYNTEEYNEEAQATKHTFGIGVSISPTLPAGEYSTTVTITAVNN